MDNFPKQKLGPLLPDGSNNQTKSLNTQAAESDSTFFGQNGQTGLPYCSRVASGLVMLCLGVSRNVRETMQMFSVQSDESDKSRSVKQPL